MNKVMLLIVVAAAIFVLPGCHQQRRISPDDLRKVKIGMTKEKLIEEIGEPSVYRGSMVNKFHQIIDVFEYWVDFGPEYTKLAAHGFLSGLCFSLCMPLYFLVAPLCCLIESRLDQYWMFFFNNKLAKWCKAGDWETAQHSIQEIRFR
jgi:hypothetical protein